MKDPHDDAHCSLSPPTFPQASIKNLLNSVKESSKKETEIVLPFLNYNSSPQHPTPESIISISTHTTLSFSPRQYPNKLYIYIYSFFFSLLQAEWIESSFLL